MHTLSQDCDDYFYVPAFKKEVYSYYVMSRSTACRSYAPGLTRRRCQHHLKIAPHKANDVDFRRKQDGDNIVRGVNFSVMLALHIHFTSHPEIIRSCQCADVNPSFLKTLPHMR